MSVDTLEELAPIAEAPRYQFTISDRCCADKGSRGYSGVEVAEQAYHRWTKGDKELFFCNHHNNVHEFALAASGWAVEHHPQHDQLDKPLDINHIDQD
jgi:hypothetical protein